MKNGVDALLVIKKATTYGICLGVSLSLFGVFESGFNFKYTPLLIGLGLGIIAAALTVFGFAISIKLMEEVTEKSKENNISQDYLHYYLDGETYYFNKPVKSKAIYPKNHSRGVIIPFKSKSRQKSNRLFK
jgi:hypothetical protein